MGIMAQWKSRAKHLKLEACTLYLACRDPRMPWHARLLGLAVVGYVLCPIDLIPDWIPVIGYLDDLLLAPLGIALVIKLTPPEVFQENRERAREMLENTPVNRVAAAIIIGIWLLTLGAIATWACHLYHHSGK